MSKLGAKKETVREYQEDMEKANVAIVAEYRGLSVAQLTELRNDLFKQDAKFSVVKNTLMKRAISGTEAESMSDLFQGPIAVLYGFGDEVTPTKTLKEFFKKAKIGEIKGGYMGGQKMDQQQTIDFSNLPSFDELRGQLVGAINSPLSGIVMALSSPGRGLVNVLDQYSEMKQKEA